MSQYVFTMNRVGKIVPPKRQILKDISLSFFPGAKIGVLGLNGSGKSTLLKIMAGVDKEIEGEAIPMPGIKIGYLPQEPQLNPEQTVREAVEEGIEEHRNDGRQQDAGIEQRLDRIASNLDTLSQVVVTRDPPAPPAAARRVPATQPSAQRREVPTSCTLRSWIPC